MPLWLLNIGGFLKGVPWKVYVIVGLLAMNPVSYCKGVSNGRQIILDRLERAEVKAKEKAEAAIGKADEKQAADKAEFAKEQAADIKAIDEAEANGENSLDALF